VKVDGVWLLIPLTFPCLFYRDHKFALCFSPV